MFSDIRLRGDDELDKLLNKLDEKVLPRQERTYNRSEAPDVSGKQDTVQLVPEQGWNKAIWNPHVIDEASTGFFTKCVLYSTPQMECLRQEALTSLKRKFLAHTKNLSVELKSDAFEKWLFGQKINEALEKRGKVDHDILLPSGHYWDAELSSDLGRRRISQKNIEEFLNALKEDSEACLQEFIKRYQRAAKPLKHAKAKVLDDDAWIIYYGKRELRINSAHFTKLYELYNRNHRRGQHVFKPTRDSDFHNALFTCLLRYEALQGGGFQAAMTGDVFDVLLSRFGVKMECFASPFNCRYSTFCTAFPDTDAAFGGLNNFFKFEPKRGSYQANPPFIPMFLELMVRHMNGLLRLAEKSGEELSFIVVIQGFKEEKNLAKSSFLKRCITLKQKDHGYCEGKQHLRKTRYRIASAPSLVYFLQSSKAAQRWPASDEACGELAAAFKSMQADEVAGMLKGNSDTKKRSSPNTGAGRGEASRPKKIKELQSRLLAVNKRKKRRRENA